jgi:hypothetical protein
VEIDFDEFAAQVDYVGRLGKLVAPRALAFVGQKILFTGDDPHSAEELSGLLPEEADSYMDYRLDYVPEDVSFDLVVVGQADFFKEAITDAIARHGQSLRFLPRKDSWTSSCSGTTGGTSSCSGSTPSLCTTPAFIALPILISLWGAGWAIIFLVEKSARWIRTKINDRATNRHNHVPVH